MIRLSDVDYATQGLFVRRAFVHARQTAGPIPKPLRAPLSLLWGGLDIVTGDIFEVPPTGRIRLEFLEVDHIVRQGVELEANRGFELSQELLEPSLRI